MQLKGFTNYTHLMKHVFQGGRAFSTSMVIPDQSAGVPYQTDTCTRYRSLILLKTHRLQKLLYKMVKTFIFLIPHTEYP